MGYYELWEIILEQNDNSVDPKIMRGDGKLCRIMGNESCYERYGCEFPGVQNVVQLPEMVKAPWDPWKYKKKSLIPKRPNFAIFTVPILANFFRNSDHACTKHTGNFIQIFD